MVSVIIRTRNRPDALYQAIDSVVSQQWRRLEIIVINDGKSPLALPTTGGIPLHYHSTGNAGNRSVAANVGVEHAKGRFLLFLDDDDLIEKKHIHSLVAALDQNPWAGVAYCGTIMEKHPGGERTHRPVPVFDLVSLLRENMFPIHSVLVRKSAVEAVDGFDESLALFEDWDLWIRLALEGFGFVRVEKWSAVYRQHLHGTLMAHPFGSSRDIEARWKVILKHEEKIRDLLLAHKRETGAASVKLIIRKLLFKVSKDLLC